MNNPMTESYPFAVVGATYLSIFSFNEQDISDLVRDAYSYARLAATQAKELESLNAEKDRLQCTTTRDGQERSAPQTSTPVYHEGAAPSRKMIEGQ